MHVTIQRRLIEAHLERIEFERAIRICDADIAAEPRQRARVSGFDRAGEHRGQGLGVCLGDAQPPFQRWLGVQGTDRQLTLGHHRRSADLELVELECLRLGVSLDIGLQCQLGATLRQPLAAGIEP